jgi:hypothetical protein
MLNGNYFIESTCMLLANRNVTVWIGILLGVHSRVTNKGGTKLYGRDRHCEDKVKGDRDHTNQ